jgi:hypothetical protein
MMTGIGRALEVAYGTHQQRQDRERALRMQEERMAAEAEDRRARAAYREAQMENIGRQQTRQERSDILADLDMQAAEAVESAIPQQDEIGKILRNLAPATVEGGGLVDLGGDVIAGTEQAAQVASDIDAPSVEALLAGDDEKVTLPGFGSVPEREVSVGDRAQAILKERRAKQAAEIKKGGLKTFFDPNTNQYTSVYEGEAREQGLLPEAAGKEYFKRQEAYRKEKAKKGTGAGVEKAPKGMWRGDTYFEYIGGQWVANEDVTGIVKKEKEDEEGRGSPREANALLTRYRDELGLQHGSDEFREQFKQEYPGDYEAVMNMIEGKIPAAKLGSMRKGRREYLVSMASAMTGRDYNESQVAAMAKTRSNFATGAEANNIRSINTAIQHLSESEKAVQDIYESFNASSIARGMVGGAGRIPMLNAMANWLATETGSDKVTKLKGALEAAASEMAAALKGGRAAPTEKEIQAQKDIISSFSSPEQIRGYIETNSRLLSGRLHALEGQWKSVFGTPPPEGSILYPSSIEIAKEHGFYDYLHDPSQAKYDPKYEAERTLYQNEEYGGQIEDIFKGNDNVVELPPDFDLDQPQ